MLSRCAMCWIVNLQLLPASDPSCHPAQKAAPGISRWWLPPLGTNLTQSLELCSHRCWQPVPTWGYLSKTNLKGTEDVSCWKLLLVGRPALQGSAREEREVFNALFKKFHEQESHKILKLA